MSIIIAVLATVYPDTSTLLLVPQVTSSESILHARFSYHYLNSQFVYKWHEINFIWHRVMSDQLSMQCSSLQHLVVFAYELHSASLASIMLLAKLPCSFNVCNQHFNTRWVCFGYTTPVTVHYWSDDILCLYHAYVADLANDDVN